MKTMLLYLQNEARSFLSLTGVTWSKGKFEGPQISLLIWFLLELVHLETFEPNFFFRKFFGSSIKFGQFWSIFAYFEAKYLQNGSIWRPLVFWSCFISILSHFWPSFIKIFKVVGKKMPPYQSKNSLKLAILKSNFLPENEN